MRNIHTCVVRPGTPEVSICARWRAENISVLETSFEEERQRLEAFVSDRSNGVALIAKCDGVAAGTCLLVPREIDPVHSVSPWLAGLFVAPEYRRLGVGAILVQAIEERARMRGDLSLYLYSDDAVGYYERLGWRVVERRMWKGFNTALMARDL